jgi:hypothetical protein
MASDDDRGLSPSSGKALRVALSDTAWLDRANHYFTERGSVGKLQQVRARC